MLEYNIWCVCLCSQIEAKNRESTSSLVANFFNRSRVGILVGGIDVLQYGSRDAERKKWSMVMGDDD